MASLWIFIHYDHKNNQRRIFAIVKSLILLIKLIGYLIAAVDV